ncbi:MAG: decapping endonuclease targeting mRNA [Heterodermia speciosa]|uniref:Decapping nuclease n=1 Tax=Heterodermia speciosa TaxID=116794 RepID=A0A8H3EW92_9LECA|nr:MAG: decapping endonuclease targeting mRNA [Heterodermia speciosa]
MSWFEIQPLSRFTGSNAAIRRPREIACFSYDDEHRFHPDERSLRYYYPPVLGADLSKGFDTFKQLDDTADDHLDGLLKTILHLEQRTGTRCAADFITWRGMMTKGTIFIEENHEHKVASRQSQHSQPSHFGGPSQEMMSFWGYKFETLSLIPDTWDATPRDVIENRENEVVNNHAQYCSIVKTGIGKAKLIIGGEVDAVWDSKPRNKNDAINWVELKTSATISNERDMLKYERKLLKFWIQSFLLGVPKIIVGFRTKDGILERLEELETSGIPGTVKKKGKGSWDGNTCIGFAAAFLDWLKATITEGGVWRIRRRERSPVIEVFKLEEAGYGDILLPAFVEWRTKGGSGDAENAIGNAGDKPTVDGE